MWTIPTVCSGRKSIMPESGAATQMCGVSIERASRENSSRAARGGTSQEVCAFPFMVLPRTFRSRIMLRGESAVWLLLLTVLFPLGSRAQSAVRAGSRISATAAEPAFGCFNLFAKLANELPVDSGGKSVRGFDPANLDRSVSPCENFYKFAVGGWMKNNPMPADHSSWGVFDKLEQRNQAVLREILEDAAKDKAAAAGSNWQKIGDFYASCMDEGQIENAGLKPLQPDFQRIAEIKDRAGLLAEIARLQRQGVNAVFIFTSEQDLKNSNLEIAGAGQGGLGLPDRQYYLDDDDRSKQLRAAYLEHVTNMFKLMGDDQTTAAAETKTVMDIETALAKASTKREDLRDPEKNYHPLALPQLEALTPNLAWRSYFKEVGTPNLQSADIGQIDFFKQVDAAVGAIPLADWKIYLRWHLIHTAARALPKQFVEENFDFYGKTLVGQQQMLPRWQRCVQATDDQLGEALGQYYVMKAFPPAAKAQALVMVKNLMAALRDDLSTLDWMSPSTRTKAIEKLDAMRLKIGYPDQWRDYSAYHVDRGPYVRNLLGGESFEFARELAKIGKPVDRSEWDMTPPTVNAYYAPPMNEIVFPAGILQPPFFDPDADDASNYGAIGAVIGHEMTHGFDDEGAKFDGQGNLKNWWTPEDLRNFQARGECIAKQFAGYQIEPGLNENGKLVEGESIADLGGLTISYAAYQKTLASKPAPPSIDGFTADQRFFLAYAGAWAENLRPEIARLYTKTDPHPLGRFRTNGPLANTPAFETAFHCAANSPMVRPAAERCRIW
jgi:putative endopeptidase